MKGGILDLERSGPAIAQYRTILTVNVHGALLEQPVMNQLINCRAAAVSHNLVHNLGGTAGRAGDHVQRRT
jgi:hypothetical protein